MHALVMDRSSFNTSSNNDQPCFGFKSTMTAIETPRRKMSTSIVNCIARLLLPLLCQGCLRQAECPQPRSEHGLLGDGEMDMYDVRSFARSIYAIRPPDQSGCYGMT